MSVKPILNNVYLSSRAKVMSMLVGQIPHKRMTDFDSIFAISHFVDEHECGQPSDIVYGEMSAPTDFHGSLCEHEKILASAL